MSISDISDAKWHALDVATTLSKLQTNLQHGLGAAAALDRQKTYGRNQVIAQQQESVLWRFLRQFHNALVYILIVSAMMAAYLGKWVDVSVIFGVVVLNAIFGFFQEGKAEKALRAISSMLAPNAKVIRDGKKVIIPTFMLVPGDVVVMERGYKVPADLRLCELKNLQAQEAILTGESLPVEKNIAAVSEQAAISERYSMLYSGTLVTDGSGLGVVVATGINTEIGKISQALAEVESITTPLLLQMNKFGRWLTLLIVVLALIVFLVGILVWHDSSSEMFMGIVGLTVAAVPEGLPPIMTIILAIGVTRMARHKAIVRRLPAVETMGAVTTICTDKTGTLTSNELMVQSIVTVQQSYLLGENISFDHSDVKGAVASVILCNDAELHQHHGGDYTAYGNPIDVALMMLGSRIKFDVGLWRQKFPRTDLIPYETEHKFMATLHHNHDNNSYIYIKGAPEIILSKCKWQQINGDAVPLDREYWQKNIENLASLGQRVIAVASKITPNKRLTLAFNDVEDELVLMALFGLIDPPREEAGLAVKECMQAGVKVKMITGDHATTARAIATSVGIESGQVLTGDMIDNMSDDELANVACDINVYARTTPQHKLRLVKALQQQGEVVAMTGDGVNDAPALKQADIGIAMGQKGADIAKESAAMVLADDNFATIVHAVSAGRTIYDNLQKAIIFILPTSFAQAFAIVIAILFGLVLPINAVQILWVNMITAVTLSLSLGFEPAENDVMQRPPRKASAPLLSWHLMWRICLVTLTLMVIVFGLFIFVYKQGFGLEVARTVAVNVLVMGEVVYLINCRNLRQSSLNWATFFGSKYVLLSIAVVILFQIFFTYIPLMQHFFNTAAINLEHWCYIISAVMVAFILVEVEKAVLRTRVSDKCC